MTTMSELTLVFLLVIAALVLNLPFGYLRSKRRKYSFMWLFYIHVPIPFIFVLRTISGIGYNMVPVIAVGAIAGQFLGGRFNSSRTS